MPAARGVKRAAASKTNTDSNTAGPSKNKKKNALPTIIAKEIPVSTKYGQVLTCGQGDVGQLGLGEDYLEKSRFTLVSALGNTIVDICAGGMHTVAIDKNGNVWTFGCNDEGALGRETTNEWAPGKVNLPGKVIKVSAGDSHTAALLETGQVYAWGSFRDSHGNMGLTPKGNERTPVEMLPGHKVVQIASGADHLAMLTDIGQIFTCGCAEQGQLGRVTARSCDRNSRLGLNPLLIPAALSFRPKDKVDFDLLWAGSHCTFAREAAKGAIYVWGLNNYQQIGVRKGSPGTVFTPVISEAFASLKDVNWTKITGGQHHSLALDSNGLCYAIGRREYGRLGLGENCEDATDLTPIPILKDKKCVQIACSSAASFAVTDTGDVYAWGMGTSGQLGTGSEEDENEPKLLRSKQLEGRFALNVSAGGQHTVLLMESLEEPKDEIAEPAAVSTAPQLKADSEKTSENETKDEKEPDSTKTNETTTPTEQTDVEMKEDAKKSDPEKMDVDEESKEETKPEDKPAKRAPAKRGRKGSASSTASTESSRSTKASKNKQNGNLPTVKETAETADSKTQDEPETQTGGTQNDDSESSSSQKQKRQENDADEPDAKRLKVDDDSAEKQVEEKKDDVPMDSNCTVENTTEKADTDVGTTTPAADVDVHKKEEENLSNGNGETESSIESKEATTDVEMKTVSDVVEKKCISSDSQEGKTEGDVTRTQVESS